MPTSVRQRLRSAGARTLGRRALGLAFIGALIFAVWLTHAIFAKTFTDSVDVTLETSHIGLQLNPQADVKLRGLIVGEVRETQSLGGGAAVDLALDSEHAGLIPANVTARILPKTLFGEKYVDLQLPAGQSAAPITAGAVIERDRTSVGIELETVLDDVHPLLQTLRPAQLHATLAAVSEALDGRGEAIGANLEKLEGYLSDLNPHVPELTENLALLADTARIYHDATPDLIRLLDNVTTTGDTVVLKRRALEDFLTDLAGTAEHAETFLADNEADLIRLGEVSRPTLDLLAEYSPEYPCLLAGMANWIPRINDAFGGGEHFAGSAPALHITLELTQQRNGYERLDRPYHGDDRGPGCRTLPNPPYDQGNPAPPAQMVDGVGAQPGPGSRAPVFDVAGDYAGSESERRLVAGLLAPVLATEPERVPDVATLLFGPMARGNAVSVR